MRYPSQDAGLVLVVDDDRGVRQVLRRMLEAGGYQVAEAVNGVEALELVQVLDPPPAVVLTELDLRVLDGSLVAQTLTVCRPEVTVVCMSSGPGPSVAPPVGLSCLRKPFPREALLEVVLRAVGRSRGLRLVPAEREAAVGQALTTHPARRRALQTYVSSGDLLAAAGALALAQG